MNKTAILAGHTGGAQGELKPFGGAVVGASKDRPAQFNFDGRRQVIKNSSYIRPPVGAGNHKASKRLVEMSDMMERSTSNNEDLMHLVSP